MREKKRDHRNPRINSTLTHQDCDPHSSRLRPSLIKTDKDPHRDGLQPSLIKTDCDPHQDRLRPSLISLLDDQDGLRTNWTDEITYLACDHHTQSQPQPPTAL